MSEVSSYGKVLALGHKFLEGLLDDIVVIQEKIDGSQFSFGDLGGLLRCRSNGQQIDLDNVPKMFEPAVKTAIYLYEEYKLIPGWTYRGETLSEPKHNVLEYARVPKDNIILFDIMKTADQDYCGPLTVQMLADKVGLEMVPTFLYDFWKGADLTRYLNDLLEEESCLGGTKIEGVVVKNYNKIGPDSKILRGKYVSKKFKEQHSEETKHPTYKDILNKLILKYRSETRFQKTIQKLKECGEFTQTSKDIGQLIQLLNDDIDAELAGPIGDELYKHFRKYILRGVTGGMAEWYKELLAKGEV